MAAWDKAVDFDFSSVTEDANTGQVGDIRMAFTDVGTSGGRALLPIIQAHPCWW